MGWMELVIETTSEGSDLAADILNSAGAAGVSIEDPAEIRDLIRKGCGWDYIKPGALNARGNITVVKGYMPASKDLEHRIGIINRKLIEMPRDYLNLGSLKFYINEVGTEDWAKSWKKHYKPIRIGQNIIIKPSWERYKPRENDVIVEMDPGMAFGTGTHESTVLCIELLEKYLEKGDRVLDIGCGSGILAVTAAKLGASSVEAYDIQQMAVDITERNAELNDVDNVVKAYKGNLLDKVRGKADVIVSNIVADTIMKMGPILSMHLNPDAIFIASGIITDRKQDVCRGFLINGLTIAEELTRNGWIALVAKAKESCP